MENRIKRVEPIKPKDILDNLEDIIHPAVIQVDRKVKKFMNDNKIPYKVVKGIGQDTINTILNDVKEKLKKKK